MLFSTNFCEHVSDWSIMYIPTTVLKIRPVHQKLYQLCGSFRSLYISKVRIILYNLIISKHYKIQPEGGSQVTL